MVELICESDSNLIKNSNFVKNASLYKDMFAFYDAYCALVNANSSGNLNCCKNNSGELCLEGVCLFMHNHAAELGFDSLSLNLDYLKVIYYTLAGYSSDGKTMPSRDVLEREFNEYNGSGANTKEKYQSEYNKKSDSYKKSKGVYDAEIDKYSHKIVAAKVLEGMSVSLIVVFFMLAMLMFTFYYVGKFSLALAITTSAMFVIVGFAVFFMLRYFARRMSMVAHDIAYDLQTKKKNKNNDYQVLNVAKRRLSKVISEKYEFEHNLNRELFLQNIDYAALFEMENKSNGNVDFEKVLISHNYEINSILLKLDKLNNDAKSHAQLNSIYQEVVSKQWLYNSNAVRYEFLKKMVEASNKNRGYKVSVNGVDSDPFGVDVKKIAKQKIAYLKSSDELFVSTVADRLLELGVIKSDRELQLATAADSDNLYNIKSEYIKHFYDYAKLSNYNNLFYGKTFNENLKVPQELLQNNSRVPYFVEMSLKLMEHRLGLENSNSATIKSLATAIKGYEATRPKIVKRAEPQPQASAPGFADELENYGIEYHLGDDIFVGYLLGNM